MITDSPLAGYVPIIGQPFEIADYAVTALVVCLCDGEKHPLLARLGGLTACPTCGKGYSVHQAMFEAGKPPQFQIGVTPRPVGN